MNKNESVTKLSDILYGQLKDLDKQIIIVNIGTDKVIGDSIAPLVGSRLLEHRGLNFKVYGTLENPIHGLNISDKIKQINEIHKNEDIFTIAIDACISDTKEIGSIEVRKLPIRPAYGVGRKDLPTIGDISIVAIVDSMSGNKRFSERNISLGLIYNLSIIIADTIVDVDRRLKSREEEKKLLDLVTRLNNESIVIGS